MYYSSFLLIRQAMNRYPFRKDGLFYVIRLPRITYTESLPDP